MATTLPKAIPLFSRRLSPPSEAAARIFNHVTFPNNKRRARIYLRRQLKGPTLLRLTLPDIRYYVPEYKSPRQIYWMAKNLHLKWKGKTPTKKGEGKGKQKAKYKQKKETEQSA